MLGRVYVSGHERLEVERSARPGISFEYAVSTSVEELHIAW